MVWYLRLQIVSEKLTKMRECLEILTCILCEQDWQISGEVSRWGVMIFGEDLVNCGRRAVFVRLQNNADDSASPSTKASPLLWTRKSTADGQLEYTLFDFWKSCRYLILIIIITLNHWSWSLVQMLKLKSERILQDSECAKLYSKGKFCAMFYLWGLNWCNFFYWR